MYSFRKKVFTSDVWKKALCVPYIVVWVPWWVAVGGWVVGSYSDT